MEGKVQHTSQHNMEMMYYHTSQYCSQIVILCITIMERMVKHTSQYNMERMCGHVSQHGSIAIY
eukprot:3227840-Ditylum_brightwellii.AAC.1